MLEKTSVVATMRKPLILQDSSLRTWPFARPQGVEKERGKTGQERQNQASRWVAKSASPSEKPRQAWGLTGLIDIQRLVEPGGIEPPSASHRRTVLHV
jgi:hypothetical protein